MNDALRGDLVKMQDFVLPLEFDHSRIGIIVDVDDTGRTVPFAVLVSGRVLRFYGWEFQVVSRQCAAVMTFVLATSVPVQSQRPRAGPDRLTSPMVRLGRLASFVPPLIRFACGVASSEGMPTDQTPTDDTRTAARRTPHSPPQ